VRLRPLRDGRYRCRLVGLRSPDPDHVAGRGCPVSHEPARVVPCARFPVTSPSRSIPCPRAGTPATCSEDGARPHRQAANVHMFARDRADPWLYSARWIELR
jgi:hypothetical protein